MKIIFFLVTLLAAISQQAFGQVPHLMSYLLTPRLDTINWHHDFNNLNGNYSKLANQCQNCVFSESDTIRWRYCINTSVGHVRLDTSFQKITVEKLKGEWKVVNAGVFEVADSLPAQSERFIRSEKITENQAGATGGIIFTNTTIKVDIQAGNHKQKKRNRYVILEGKYLMTKKIGGLCGPTMIGITDSGLLIMDNHSYRTRARKDGYFVVRTYIIRTILKRLT